MTKFLYQYHEQVQEKRRQRRRRHDDNNRRNNNATFSRTMFVVYYLFIYWFTVSIIPGLSFTYLDSTTTNRRNIGIGRRKRISRRTAATKSSTWMLSASNDDNNVSKQQVKINWCPSSITFDQVSKQYPETLWRKLTSSVPRRQYALQNITFHLFGGDYDHHDLCSR